MKIIVNIKNQGRANTHRIVIGKDVHFNPWQTPPTVSANYWVNRIKSIITGACNMMRKDAEIFEMICDFSIGMHKEKMYFGEIMDVLDKEEGCGMVDEETKSRIIQILERHYGDGIWEKHYEDYKALSNPFQTYTFAGLGYLDDVYEFIIPDEGTKDYQRLVLECLLTIFAHGGFLQNGIKIIGE